jgi:hypothetical protein
MSNPAAVSWMMRPRSVYVGIGAGVAVVVLLVVAAIGLCRGGDRGDAPPAVDRRDAPSSAVRAEPEVPALSSSVGRGSVVADEELPVPTELPDSPSLAKELSRNGAIPDYREVYTYQLGLMAFYQACMKGRIRRGLIYYYIKWGVVEDHIATAPFYDRADVPSEGDVTPEDELAFEACVKEYLATHDRVSLPHASPSGEAWGMRAVFPLSESFLLKAIAEATADSR